MQTAYQEKEPPNPKGVQVEFVTDIQSMLECFVSLYELKKSSLQEVFLRPCSQYEDGNCSSDDDYTHCANVTNSQLNVINSLTQF